MSLWILPHSKIQRCSETKKIISSRLLTPGGASTHYLLLVVFDASLDPTPRTPQAAASNCINYRLVLVALHVWFHRDTPHTQKHAHHVVTSQPSR